MALTCEACKGNISVTQKRIKCTVCHYVFHSECVNYNNESSSPRSYWKCPNCVVSQRKGDNSNTPLLTNKQYLKKNKPTTVADNADTPMFTLSDNTLRNIASDCNFHNVIRQLEGMLDSKLKLIKQELIEELKSSIFTELKHEMLTLSTNLSQLHEVCEQLHNENEDLKKDLSSLRDRVCESENQVSQLRAQIGKQQQTARLNNLEVVGLPQTSNESPTNLIIKIAKHAGVDLQLNDIEFAHRVQPLMTVQGRPKPIVAKLKDRKLKDEILSGLRRRKGVNTTDIGLGNDNKKIFINEHLTPENKSLLKSVKSLAKENAFKYVWVRNCNIFLRKNEESPVIYISCQEDLKKIV